MDLGLGYCQLFQIQTQSEVILQEWYIYFITLKRIFFFHFITLLLLRNKKDTGQELTFRKNLMKQSHLTLKVSLKTQLLLTITVIQAANEIKFVQATTNIQMHLTMITSTTVWEIDSKGFWRRCITQNYWVFGLFPSSGILENRKHDVSETGSVSVLRWRREKTPTQLGPLERANLSHWISSF
jgi:hypothetical protein